MNRAQLRGLVALVVLYLAATCLLHGHERARRESP